MRRTPERLVFIDETSVKTNMTRAGGRAPKGKRLQAHAPAGLWNTQTFIAGLTEGGLIAPWVIKGAMDRLAFDTYVQTQLAPALLPGTVVILDNLATHKSPHAAQILKDKGCWFLFLPPYSPDLNPIEMAFAKLKAHLKRIGARTFDQLLNAIGDICALFSPQECSNFLRHAGYLST
jgi:transposase